MDLILLIAGIVMIVKGKDKPKKTQFGWGIGLTVVGALWFGMGLMYGLQSA